MEISIEDVARRTVREYSNSFTFRAGCTPTPREFSVSEACALAVKELISHWNNYPEYFRHDADAFARTLERRGISCSTEKVRGCVQVISYHGALDIWTRFEKGRILSSPWDSDRFKFEVKNLSRYVEALAALPDIERIVKEENSRIRFENEQESIVKQIGEVSDHALVEGLAGRLGATSARYSSYEDSIRFVMPLDGGVRTLLGNVGRSEEELASVEEAVKRYARDKRPLSGPVKIWEIPYGGQNWGPFEYSVGS